MKFLSFKYWIFILLIFSACTKNDNENSISSTPEEVNNNLLQISNNKLVDFNKQPVYLQGVAFGNEIWSNAPIPPETHHSEIDYQRVKAMGMNAVRFYLNYRFFEDDTNPYIYKQSGWDWLDKNIQWAKQNNIYLILNMHAPQGGYQSQGTGDALWNIVENQNRLTALWKEIANKYKYEPTIAGFGLVNEPVPTSSIEQWSNLAQKIITEIRTVNKNHLIFIEKAIYVKGNYVPNENLNFPNVTGGNIIYEFHGYDPLSYTHQLLEFAKLGDGGKYPDENTIETSDSQWYTATFNNPTISYGNSDWNYFEGVKYKITDDKIKIAQPALIGASVNGTVYFDDINIKEYDENGTFTKNVVDINLNTIDGWYYWSANDSGTVGLKETEGHNDLKCLFISNATDDCNLSSSKHRFIPKKNYYYQISGWMKGNNVATNGACKLRIDFSTTESPILVRNKAYLASILKKNVDWAAKNKTILFMGEFGAGAPCFENDKGGLQFVKDMVDLAKEYNIHFTYHAYHEDSFGIYKGYGTLPDPNNVNQPLINLFTQILN